MLVSINNVLYTKTVFNLEIKKFLLIPLFYGFNLNLILPDPFV